MEADARSTLHAPGSLSSGDLAAYLERIGFDGAKDGSVLSDLETLTFLHRAHAYAIPFENLALHWGEGPIRLDLPGLFDKLVVRRRGGYCFEQNSLFQAVLRTLGFDVTAFEARVRMGAHHVLPRTHMVLRVEVEGGAWLADVGFGGDGLVEPVPWDGRAIEHGARRYRIVREPDDGGELAVLQVLGMPGVEGWLDLYAIEPKPVREVDLEVANWYTSTSPDSKFVTTLTVQRITPEARTVLRGRTLTRVGTVNGTPAEVESRELSTDEIEALLAEFGLPRTGRPPA